MDYRQPFSIETEKTVLASMLTDRDACFEALELLNVDDFYSEAHKSILQAINTLVSSDRPVDLVTVPNELKRAGALSETLTNDTIFDLIENVGSTRNIRAHCWILQQKSTLRRLIKMGLEIAQESQSDNADAEKISAYAEAVLSSIRMHTDPFEIRRYRDVVKVAHEEIKNSRGGHTSGIPTGIEKLDKYTAGMHDGDLVIIAARPSMGKTSLALKLAKEALKNKPDEFVVIFSLEMPDRQLAQRDMASESRVDMLKLRSGCLSHTDLSALQHVVEKLCEQNLIIDDTPGMSPAKIRSRLRKIERECGKVSMVLIDYMQLMDSDEPNHSRQQEMTKISRSLKGVAKEFTCPVIALSQLSRLCEQRGANKRPILSDLRESGAIEQDADIVIFIYRDVVYNKKTDEKNVAELIIRKQRNGPVGTIKTFFDDRFMLFENLKNNDEEYDIEENELPFEKQPMETVQEDW